MAYIPSELDLSNCFITLDDNTTKTIKSLANSSASNNLINGGTISGNLSVTGNLVPSTFIVPSSTYEKLPSTPVLGAMVLVTDGLKPGEDTGSGTGVLCVYDGKNWVDISSGTTILI